MKTLTLFSLLPIVGLSLIAGCSQGYGLPKIDGIFIGEIVEFQDDDGWAFFRSEATPVLAEDYFRFWRELRAADGNGDILEVSTQAVEAGIARQHGSVLHAGKAVLMVDASSMKPIPISYVISRRVAFRGALRRLDQTKFSIRRYIPSLPATHQPHFDDGFIILVYDGKLP